MCELSLNERIMDLLDFLILASCNKPQLLLPLRPQLNNNKYSFYSKYASACFHFHLNFILLFPFQLPVLLLS